MAVWVSLGYAKANVQFGQHQILKNDVIESKVRVEALFNNSKALDELLASSNQMTNKKQEEFAIIIQNMKSTPGLSVCIGRDFFELLQSGRLNLSLYECELSSLCAGNQQGKMIEISASWLAMDAVSRMMVNESTFAALDEQHSRLQTAIFVPNNVKLIIAELSVLHSIVELALSVKYPYLLSLDPQSRPDYAIEALTITCVWRYLNHLYGNNKAKEIFDTYYPAHSRFCTTEDTSEQFGYRAMLGQKESAYLLGVYQELANTYKIKVNPSEVRSFYIAHDANSFYSHEIKDNEFSDIRLNMLGDNRGDSNSSWHGFISTAVEERGNPEISKMLSIPLIQLSNYYTLEDIAVSESVYKVDKSNPFKLRITSIQRSEIGLFTPSYYLACINLDSIKGGCVFWDMVIQLATHAKGSERDMDAFLSTALHELTHAYSFREYPFLMDSGLSNQLLDKKTIGEGFSIAVQYNDWVEYRGGREICQKLIQSSPSGIKDACLQAFFIQNGTTALYQSYLKNMLNVFEDISTSQQSVYKIKLDKTKLDEEEKLARSKYEKDQRIVWRALYNKLKSAVVSQPVQVSAPTQKLCNNCENKNGDSLGKQRCKVETCPNYGNVIPSRPNPWKK